MCITPDEAQRVIDEEAEKAAARPKKKEKKPAGEGEEGAEEGAARERTRFSGWMDDLI